MGSEAVAAKIISCAFYFFIGLPWRLSSKKKIRLPMEETWVESLGQENHMEKEMAIHSSIPAGKFPRQRSLECYGPWGHKESDMTERLSHNSYFLIQVPVIMSPVF